MSGMETTGGWGVPAEHLAGLYALLLSPLAIWLLQNGTRLLARLGSQWSGRFLARYQSSPLPIRVASWLMLTTGFIHLALVPAHWSEEPGTAILFVLDAALFFVASIGVFWGDWWRRSAALLCLATILAYLFYLVTGREDIDQLGMATKLIELAALGLLFVPPAGCTNVAVVRAGSPLPGPCGTDPPPSSGEGNEKAPVSPGLGGDSSLRWREAREGGRGAGGREGWSGLGGEDWSADNVSATRSRRMQALSIQNRRRWRLGVMGLLALTVVTGSVACVAEVRAETHHGRDIAAAQADDRANLTGMVMQPVSTSPATAAQIEAADQLAAATKTGIAKYQDIAVALAAGYRPATSSHAPIVHYSNPSYHNDGDVLDPSRPETLVYANTSHGVVLLGAMYEMPKAGEFGPDVGGPLTPWHVHTGICFGPFKRALIVGIVSPFGACPAGSVNVTTPGMLHVWTYGRSEGPFGDLSQAEIDRIVGK